MAGLGFAARAGMLALALGCSTTSTITRVNDFPIEVEVIGGSSDTIFVANEDGSVRELPRNEIVDVDYPGNVHAITGGVLAGYGILNVMVGAGDCDTNGAAYCAGVFTPLIVGALIATWGFVVHQEQTSAVADTSMRSYRRRDPGDAGRALRPRRAPPRPPPDTRPVAPIPVELEEDKTQEPPAAPTPPSPPALPPADAPPPSPAPPSPSPSRPAPPSAAFPPDP